MKRLLIGFCSLLTLSSCATIVGGTDQNIAVDSNVKGAEVIYNGLRVGETPFAGKVKKAKEPSVMVKADGYDAQTQILSTTTPTIFWGNIILGGTVGSTTDYASGAMFEISPASYYINLKKSAVEPADEKPAPVEAPKKSTPKKTEKSEKSTKYDFDKDTEIKKFSMMNFENISKDLARGGGEYTDSLATLLGSKASDKEATLNTLKKLHSAANGNVVVFGESVASYYFDKAG